MLAADGILQSKHCGCGMLDKEGGGGGGGEGQLYVMVGAKMSYVLHWVANIYKVG